MSIKNTSFIAPGRMVLLSVLVTIACGALLLALPYSQKVPVSLLDIIFTTISATTVTGLLTVPMDSFTYFGQSIILLLIQIGGLGLITLTIFLMSFFVELGLATQLVAGQVFEVSSFKKTRQLITFIAGLTAGAEVLGTAAMWFILPQEYSGLERLFHAAFHAISSFCNAGFSILPVPMAAMRSNIPFLIVTILLVALGGFGFMTLYEIFRVLPQKNKKLHHLSLSTKVVISTTAAITLAATLLIGMLEYDYSFTNLPSFTMAVNALFDGVCARSTGFSTLDMSTIRQASLFIIMIVSFIGSSPGSTGSGIKTTTFAIFIATIRAVLSGRMVVEIKSRRIPTSHVFKALAIFLLSLTWICLAIFALLLVEEGWNFLDITFESFSAFANLGLSSGLTPYLSIMGKMAIMSLMIIGRIGTITLLLALRRRHETADFRYPEERIMLG